MTCSVCEKRFEDMVSMHLDFLQFGIVLCDVCYEKYQNKDANTLDKLNALWIKHNNIEKGSDK